MLLLRILLHIRVQRPEKQEFKQEGVQHPISRWKMPCQWHQLASSGEEKGQWKLLACEWNTPAARAVKLKPAGLESLPWLHSCRMRRVCHVGHTCCWHVQVWVSRCGGAVAGCWLLTQPDQQRAADTAAHRGQEGLSWRGWAAGAGRCHWSGRRQHGHWFWKCMWQCMWAVMQCVCVCYTRVDWGQGSGNIDCGFEVSYSSLEAVQYNHSFKIILKIKQKWSWKRFCL